MSLSRCEGKQENLEFAKNGFCDKRRDMCLYYLELDPNIAHSHTYNTYKSHHAYIYLYIYIYIFIYTHHIKHTHTHTHTYIYIYVYL
jgi:hypothetical protein